MTPAQEICALIDGAGLSRRRAASVLMVRTMTIQSWYDACRDRPGGSPPSRFVLSYARHVFGRDCPDVEQGLANLHYGGSRAELVRARLLREMEL